MPEKAVAHPIAALMAAILAFWALPALAVWSESIQVVGEAPVPAGATVTLTLAGGETVGGEVSEDRRRIVFLLPGNTPGEGTVVVATAQGDVFRYALPPHTSEEQMALDLSDGEIRSLPIATTEQTILEERPWGLSIGVGYAYWMSDYFSATIRDNERELVGILADLGATDIVTDGSADTSADGYVLMIAAHYNLTPVSDLFLELGYGRPDAFQGGITGSADLFGNEFRTIASGESELEMISAVLGYEHQLGSAERWRWYVEVGGMWTDLDDASTTLAYVNGTEVENFDASSNDDDSALLLGGGVRYRVPFGDAELVFDLGAQQSNELFNGEGLTRIGLSIGVGF